MTKNKALGKPPHECGDGVCENGYSCREEHYKTALIEAAERVSRRGWVSLAKDLRVSAGVKGVSKE